MADLSITAADVVPGTSAVIDKAYVYGETVTAGMPVYLSGTGSTAKWMMALNDSVAHCAARGVAINSGSLNQPAAVQTSGYLTINSAATAGASYWVSNTAGKLAPETDISNAEYSTLVAIGVSATSMLLAIHPTGVLHG